MPGIKPGQAEDIMNNKSVYSFFSLFFLVFLTTCFVSSSQQLQEMDRDVPFVVTPIAVLQEMLRLAAPQSGDMLIDLGSGDGRIVINAAVEFGIRGMGIEIDPSLVNLSRKNALAAGVQKLVEFRQQDLFTVDLSPASVLTMYLLPEINLRLRPKILREMKPGSRVVSHDFDMGEWQPDETSTVFGEWLHVVSLWLVPANVTGSWSLVLDRPVGQAGRSFNLELGQKFQVIHGSLAEPNQEARPILNPNLRGEMISFSVTETRADQEVILKFQGRVENDVMTGSLEIIGREGTLQTTGWKASRRKDSKKPRIY